MSDAEEKSLGDVAEDQFRLWDALDSAPKDAPLQWEESVAATLRAVREAYGWSQTFAVDQLRAQWGIDMHQTTLAKLEAGKRPVRLAELYALATLYGQSVSSVLHLASERGSALEGSREIDDEYFERRERMEATLDASLEYLHGTFLELAGEHAKLSAMTGYLSSAGRARAEALHRGDDPWPLKGVLRDRITAHGLRGDNGSPTDSAE